VIIKPELLIKVKEYVLNSKCLSPLSTLFGLPYLSGALLKVTQLRRQIITVKKLSWAILKRAGV
jgi:hypothetical protein